MNSRFYIFFIQITSVFDRKVGLKIDNLHTLLNLYIREITCRKSKKIFLYIFVMLVLGVSIFIDFFNYLYFLFIYFLTLFFLNFADTFTANPHETPLIL